MQILDVKAFPAWVGSRNQLVVKVETDAGLVGWGEAGVSGRGLAVVGAIRHFREFLVGKDPMQRVPHNPLGPICTAATIHLAAAVPNFAWLEVRTSPTEQLGFDNAELFPVQPRIEGNRFPVPDLPGLGVE